MQQDIDRRGGEPPEPPYAETPQDDIAASSADQGQYVVVATLVQDEPANTAKLIYNIARLICEGAGFHVAQEVAAIAILKVFRLTDVQVRRDSVNAYFHTVVKNTAIDLARSDARRRRREALDGHEVTLTRAAPDPNNVPDARTALIYAETRKRMGDLADVMDLREIRKMKWKHIATHLFPNASKSDISKKMRALKRRYQRRFEVVSKEVSAMFKHYDA